MIPKNALNRMGGKSWIELLELMPLLIAITILPLIVYLKVNPAEVSNAWNSSWDYDFFSYYKSLVLIILSGPALVILVLKSVLKREVMKKTKLYWPLLGFSICVFLSAIFSDYPTIAWSGFYNRYEGALAIMAYAILFVYTVNCVHNKKQVKTILLAFLLSMILIMTIGIFQFFGLDLFRTEIGTRLILPKVYEDPGMQITLQVEETQIFSTFKHPNYYGSYMAICLPFLGCLFILSKEKKYRIFFGILFAAGCFTLLGSRSRGGLLGISVAFLVFLIVFRKIVFRNWKRLLAICIIGLAGLFATDSLTGGVLIAKIRSITSDPRIQINRYHLQDIILEDPSLKIISAGSYLELQNIGNYGLAFKDKTGNYLFYSVDNKNKIHFEKDEYARYDFQFGQHEEGPGLIFNYGSLTAHFLITKTSFRFIDPSNHIVDLEEIPSWGFKGKELWGSSRGYIWSRTLPMIKSNLLIGKGPDTFAIYFPQNDYIGKLISYDTMKIIVDKPHNMYLQTAVNTGLISLLALIIFLLMYIVSSIRWYWKHPPHDLLSNIGVAILFSVIGYMTTGIFNDSVVSVSTVFWILLGLGVSINLHLYHHTSEESG